MATTFGTTITRNDVINATLRTIGKLGQTQIATPEDFANCSQALNLMIKAWMNRGPTLWKIEMIEIPMVANVIEYSIGPSATGSGAVVMSLPIKFLDQGNYIRNNDQDFDTMVTMLSKIEYNLLGNKSLNGTQPCQFYADLQIPNRKIFVYPPPGNDGVSRSLWLVAQMIISDTTDAAGLFDFPQEFMNALKWGLANEILAEYGVDEQTERRVMRMYDMYVTSAFDFSVEEAGTFFTYNTGGRGGG